MSLTEQKNIDKIEITEMGVVQVREVTRILKDGEEVAKTYHRWTIEPGRDYSSQPDNIKSICEITHTPAVIAAYEAQIQTSNQFLQ